MSENVSVEQHAIRARAYELWNERGRPSGSPERDWLEAEGELRTRRLAIPAPLPSSNANSTSRPRRSRTTRLRTLEHGSGTGSGTTSRLLARLVAAAVVPNK